MSRRTAMALLLRRGQWLLDEAAFEIGGDRYTPECCRDTAHALTELAAALDEYSHEITPTGETTAPTSADAEPDAAPETAPHTAATARAAAAPRPATAPGARPTPPAPHQLPRTPHTPGGAPC
ncbi:hypothetical protein GCM10027174_13090 [Salinifilum aidingensis]